MSTATMTDPRQTMRELTDVLREGAADVDERRAISPEVSQILKDAGVFGLLAPQRIGGAEVDPLTFFDVVEQASYADGSVGWTVMIGGCYATFGGMLPPAAAREIYGDPQKVTAGAFRPNGVAVEVDGGYRVTGRWPQGSGACHADWFLGGAVIVRDGEPVMGPAGVPMMRELWFPADEVEIIDTWTTTGLRGTASHDYAVEDVFVPAERSCWFMEPPTEPGPLYQMAPIAMFATFISAVPLGIARHALDEFVALSQRKVPVLSQDVLADKPVANTKLGRAKALVESGHGYVRDCWRSSGPRSATAIARPWPIAARCGWPPRTPGRPPSRPSSCSTARPAPTRSTRPARSTVACATPGPRCSTSARRRSTTRWPAASPQAGSRARWPATGSWTTAARASPEAPGFTARHVKPLTTTSTAACDTARSSDPGAERLRRPG